MHQTTRRRLVDLVLLAGITVLAACSRSPTPEVAAVPMTPASTPAPASAPASSTVAVGASMVLVDDRITESAGGCSGIHRPDAARL